MKDKEFYPIRSEAISSLISFIKACDELGRDIEDELNEILWESQDEYGVKDDDKLQIT